MGSPDCPSERRKSVRQVRSTKKKVGSSALNEEENTIRGAGNDSQIVKQEELPQQMTPKPSYGWQNPAELNYFTPHDWNDTKIIYHLIAYAFDVPPKNPRNGQPFCQIISMDGTKSMLPNGYRIPLMFLARFQWLSLKLVLSAANRQVEWEEYKYGILHVSRLCKQLLDSAQAALAAIDHDSKPGSRAKQKGIDRKWRCSTFDRALVRYRLKWFISKPAQIKEFWTEYGEDEYDRDVVGMGWRGWALKGHKGFSLTEEEIENGISAQQLMQGLKEIGGQWLWETEGTPAIDGTDAWALRHKALGAIPSFSAGSNSIPVPCLPLTLTNSSNVPSLNPPFKAPSTTISKTVTYQHPPASSPSASLSISSPKSKSKSKGAHHDIMQIMRAAGVRLSPGTLPNTDVNSSETLIPVAARMATASNGGPSDDKLRNRSVSDKRPGSPLEKDSPAKRTLRSSLSQFNSSSTLVGSEYSDPEHPPFTPTVPPRAIKRETSLDPDVEILHSAPVRFKRRTSGRNLDDGSQNGIPTSPMSSSAFSNITKDEAARLMKANENELEPMVQDLQRSTSQNVAGDGDDSIIIDTRSQNSPTEDPPLSPFTSGSRLQAPSNAFDLPPRSQNSPIERPSLPPFTSISGNKPQAPPNRQVLRKPPSPPPSVLPPRSHNSPTERPPLGLPPFTSGNRPQAPPNTIVLPPRPSVVIPPFSRPSSTTSRLNGPLFNHAKPSQNGNALPSPSQQVPSPSPVHLSPPIASNAKTVESIRPLHPQWQQLHHEKGSELATYVPGMNGVPNTPGPSSLNQFDVVSLPPNLGNLRLMESLLPLMLEDTLRKFAAEIKEVKEGINDVKEVVQMEIQNGVSEVIRGEMLKVSRGVGDVKREVQSGLAGLGSQLEKGLQSYMASHLDKIVRSATKEEVERMFGDAGMVRDLLTRAASGSKDVVDELRRELAKSRQREQKLDDTLQEMRGELKSIKEAVSSGEASRGATGVAPQPIARAENSFLLFGHPLAHLCSETFETDEANNLSDRIPGLSYSELTYPDQGLTYPDQGLSSSQDQALTGEVSLPSGQRRSYSGTPMSMSPEIVLLEPEPAEQKYKVPDPVPIETPVVPPRPPPPNLYEDIIDVKPIIINGEAFLPNTAGEPTPLAVFPSPIPARSHRKFRKMGMMNGGERNS